MIDLSAITDRALKLLHAQGMSAKNLYAYKHTGFGCIIRHFREKGISCVTPTMLDAFLLEYYELFEQKAFSLWKWRILRRSCELLKFCATDDSVALKPLCPWNHTLRCPKQSISNSVPTPEQFADKDNIFTLVWKTHQAMIKLGLSDTTIRHYRTEGLSVILNRHYKERTESFSTEIVNKLVSEKRTQYEYGKTSRVSYQNLRKAVHWLLEMHNTGNITAEKIPNWGLRNLCKPFYLILQEYYTNAEQKENMAKTSLKVAVSAVRRFLFELEDHNFCSLTDLTSKNVNSCITDFAKHYKGGLNSAMHSVRSFLRFIHDKGITTDDLSKSLPQLIVSRKIFHEGFTQDELEHLLNMPDRNTPIGKRNYAIMLLAAQSGLRACDIVRLELNNIDWRAMEIRIVQHKTGQPLALPLEIESGNAMADYILNGRPKTKLPYMFLCHIGVHRPLDAHSASAMVSKYMKQANIYAGRRAFHALRRTFGTKLLQNETPMELIQQLLGQTDINSMKPYLSIDEQGLKQCALPMIFHGKAGD